MKCYLVEVEVTSPLKTTFQSGGKYYSCVEGQVYVFAGNIVEAAAQLPNALSIRELGRAFTVTSPEAKISPVPIGG